MSSDEIEVGDYVTIAQETSPLTWRILSVTPNRSDRSPIATLLSGNGSRTAHRAVAELKLHSKGSAYDRH